MFQSDKETILLVDDAAENIDVLSIVLGPFYRLKVATSGKLAINIASGENRPDLILLDVVMPDINGYEVCEKLKNQPHTADIPVIFLTSKTDSENEAKGLELGAVDYIAKPVSAPIVLQRVKTQLTLYRQNRNLDQLVKKRTDQLYATQLNVIHCLGRAGEYKDNETGLHVIRMSQYSKLIAEAFGVDESVSTELMHVAPMHDIGKIGIPDDIMLKPGKLNEEEWVIMKTHPQIGVDLIGEYQCDLLESAKIVSLYHHEKWDGSGYPHGLIGKEIPLIARIGKSVV